ncbi:zinc-dependent alcohol dehydrogenase [Vibrio hepatarius]|uniref:zinc-dependent alcohol dehydrogenase n=1 Tax=Vibrio hepatarius TaxID=171383 RepID=UPI00142D619C|nr:zinc-binding dehydrogenase [Vibrio hepatarius]NIY84383.1 zinc-binding dehydrogenase [Vibrio hepatarius]
MKRKCAVLTEPKKFQIIEEELPQVQPHEVLVEVEAIGLCHSDMPTYLGDSQLGFDKRGHMAMIKDIQYPAHIGHESVGIIKEIGSDVTDYKVGDYVAFMPAVAGFSSHLVVPTAFCIPIPSEVPREELKYCLAEPLMCVGNIVKVANPSLGETVAVVGCGMMGLLTIAGLKHSAASKIIAVDVQESRLELARKFGATHTINPTQCDLTDMVDELTNNLGADVVVEITGSLRGLKTALKVIRYGDLLGAAGRGKVLIPSLYSREETWDPEIGYELAYRSPVLHSVHPLYAEDYIKVAKESIEACTKGILPIKDLITHEFALEDIQDGFDLMESGDPSYIKGIIKP